MLMVLENSSWRDAFQFFLQVLGEFYRSQRFADRDFAVAISDVALEDRCIDAERTNIDRRRIVRPYSARRKMNSGPVIFRVNRGGGIASSNVGVGYEHVRAPAKQEAGG